MGPCHYCRAFVVAGGVRDADGNRYCRDSCRRGGHVAGIADDLPAEAVLVRADQIHQGDCPKCGGAGPVDMHTAYYIWSAVYFSSWRNAPELSYRACAKGRQLKAVLFCGTLGWWSAHGIFMTPWQLAQNAYALFRPPTPGGPSEALRRAVAHDLATVLAEAQEDGRKVRRRRRDDE